MLFSILKDHGHVFSSQFWIAVFNSIVLPIFNFVSEKEVPVRDDQSSPSARSSQSEGSTWDSETASVAAHCLVDLFVSFFDVVRPQLSGVVLIIMGFIKSPVQGTASTGVAALVRLTDVLGIRLSEHEWRQIYVGLKEATESTIPGFLKVLGTMDNIEFTRYSQTDVEMDSDHGLSCDDIEDDNLHTAAYVISRMKSHIAVQLLLIQVPLESL